MMSYREEIEDYSAPKKQTLESVTIPLSEFETLLDKCQELHIQYSRLFDQLQRILKNNKAEETKDG